MSHAWSLNRIALLRVDPLGDREFTAFAGRHSSDSLFSWYGTPAAGWPLNSFSTLLAGVGQAEKKIGSFIRYDHDFRGNRCDGAKKISTWALTKAWRDLCTAMLATLKSGGRVTRLEARQDRRLSRHGPGQPPRLSGKQELRRHRPSHSQCVLPDRLEKGDLARSSVQPVGRRRTPG